MLLLIRGGSVIDPSLRSIRNTVRKLEMVAASVIDPSLRSIRNTFPEMMKSRRV